LYYNDSQIEAVVSAITNLTLEPEMQLDFYYVSGAVLVLPFYIGSEELGRQKSGPLFGIGPVAADTAEASYDSWNDGSASFCLDGGRKPVYAANLKTLKPAAWRSIWDELNAFVEEYPDANETSILTECYPISSLWRLAARSHHIHGAVTNATLWSLLGIRIPASTRRSMILIRK
jgi:hypothetical protein